MTYEVTTKHANSPNRCDAEATEPTAIFAEDVTCPACARNIRDGALRSGLRMAVEKLQGSIGLVVMNLCVWEGRGDWGTLPDEYRKKSARRALVDLNKAITALEVQRAQLHGVLKMTGVDPE